MESAFRVSDLRVLSESVISRRSGRGYSGELPGTEYSRELPVPGRGKVSSEVIAQTSSIVVQ